MTIWQEDLLIEELARRFSKLLLAQVPDQDELIQENRRLLEEDPEICASHDYTDPNQIMLDAMHDLGIANTVYMVNKAWELARKTDFYTEE